MRITRRQFLIGAGTAGAGALAVIGLSNGLTVGLRPGVRLSGGGGGGLQPHPSLALRIHDWSLNNTPDDDVGGLTLTLNNDPPAVDGDTGFDFTGDFVNAQATNFDLPTGDTSATWLIWIKAPDANLSSFRFFDAGGSSGFIGTSSSGQINFRLGLRRATTASAVAFDTAQKIMLVAVYDADAGTTTGYYGYEGDGAVTVVPDTADVSVTGSTTVTMRQCSMYRAVTFGAALSEADVNAWLAAGSEADPTIAAGTYSIALTAPVAYQTYQRDGSDQADIAISGTYVGTPSAIEARFNGGSWATIDASPSGGTYSGTLSAQAAGQGTLEVRFVDAPGVTASVDNVGIGDVFVIGGQSNASGRGNNNQSYSHATLKAALFGNDYAWQELTDPTDSNSGQVDTVSDDSAAGSCWPLLATQIMAATGYPVAFVPAPKGGTSIAQWQPGVDHQDRSTLYGSMVYRANQVGTVKAVLWWQGERDAVLGTAEATYNSGLDTVANAVNADLSCSLVVCKIADLSTYNTGYDETAVNNAIATAWSDNANVVAGPDFSDITPSVDGVHFKTNQELQAAADRWFAALQAAGLV